MARVKINESIIALNTGAGATSTVTITNRDTGSNATLYTAETGGTTTGNPVTATNGRLEVWVDPGRYNLAITSTGFVPYTQAFEAQPAQSSGALDIVTTESVTVDGSYHYFPTADKVTIHLPTDGLIFMLYQARLTAGTTSGFAGASLGVFLNSVQAKFPNGSPIEYAVTIGTSNP